MKKFYKNTIKIILAILLLLSPYSGIELSHALVLSDDQDAVQIEKTQQIIMGNNILPEKYGEVQHFYNGDSNRIVFHIQDAHCNYAAQKRISEIIKYLSKNYGVSLINLEGGRGNYDLDLFTSIKPLPIRERVLDYFVKEGLVNGAEELAASGKASVKLWGIENEDLYNNSIETYRTFLEYSDDTCNYLADIRKALNNLKIRIYSGELLDLDIKYSLYKDEKISFKEYMEYLFSKAGKESGIYDGLENIEKFKVLDLMEEKIDFKRANEERGEILLVLDRKMSKKALEELMRATIQFERGKISERDFYKYIKKISGFFDVDLARYLNFNRYMEYLDLYDSIDNLALMDEISVLEGKIKGSLIHNNDQRELIDYSYNLVLLSNMFKMQTSISDYILYRENRDKFAMGNYLDFIKNMSVKYGLDNGLDGDIRGLDTYIDMIEKFYEYSFDRDREFMNNLLFGDCKLLGSDRKISILVTGGFHTDNLCRLFRKNGISYVSIAPDFINEDGYECPYFNLLSGGKSDLVGLIDTAMTLIQVPSILSELRVKGMDVDKYNLAARIVESAYRGEEFVLQLDLPDHEEFAVFYLNKYGNITYKRTEDRNVIIDRTGQEETYRIKKADVFLRPLAGDAVSGKSTWERDEGDPKNSDKLSKEIIEAGNSLISVVYNENDEVSVDSFSDKSALLPLIDSGLLKTEPLPRMLEKIIRGMGDNGKDIDLIRSDVRGNLYLNPVTERKQMEVFLVHFLSGEAGIFPESVKESIFQAILGGVSNIKEFTGDMAGDIRESVIKNSSEIIKDNYRGITDDVLRIYRQYDYGETLGEWSVNDLVAAMKEVVSRSKSDVYKSFIGAWDDSRRIRASAEFLNALSGTDPGESISLMAQALGQDASGAEEIVKVFQSHRNDIIIEGRVISYVRDSLSLLTGEGDEINIPTNKMKRVSIVESAGYGLRRNWGVRAGENWVKFGVPIPKDLRKGEIVENIINSDDGIVLSGSVSPGYGDNNREYFRRILRLHEYLVDLNYSMLDELGAVGEEKNADTFLDSVTILKDDMDNMMSTYYDFLDSTVNGLSGGTDQAYISDMRAKAEARWISLRSEIELMYSEAAKTGDTGELNLRVFPLNDVQENLKHVNTLHDMINYVHQTSFDVLFKLAKANGVTVPVHVAKGIGVDTGYYSKHKKLSIIDVGDIPIIDKEGKITSDIFRAFTNCIDTWLDDRGSKDIRLIFDDNKLISDISLGDHSCRIIFNLSEPDDGGGIFIEYQEGAKNIGNSMRLLLVEKIFEALGLDVEEKNFKLNAKLDSNTGLKGRYQIIDLIPKIMKTFLNIQDYNKEFGSILVKNLGRESMSFTVDDLRDHEKVVPIVEHLRDSFMENTRFISFYMIDAYSLDEGSFEPLNLWLSGLGLDRIPDRYKNRITQRVIDEYVNVPVKEGIRMGCFYIKNDQVEVNKEYDPLAVIMSKIPDLTGHELTLNGLRRIRSKDINKVEELLQAADIVTGIQNYIDFTPVKFIGGLLAQSGLFSYRGNDYLVAILMDQEGKIEFAQIHTIEGVNKKTVTEISPEAFVKETGLEDSILLVNHDVKYIRNSLTTFRNKWEVPRDDGPKIAKGRPVSPGESKAYPVIMKKMSELEEGEELGTGILLTNYTSPEDVPQFGTNYKAIVSAGGSPTAHTAIVAMEKGIPSVILRNVHIEKDGEGRNIWFIRSFMPVSEKTGEEKGLPQYDFERKTIRIESGNYISINGKKGVVSVFKDRNEVPDELLPGDEAEEEEGSVKTSALNTFNDVVIEDDEDRSIRGLLGGNTVFSIGEVNSYISFFEDLGLEVEPYKFVGGKAYNLSWIEKLKDSIGGFSTADGIVVSTSAFYEFIENAGLTALIEETFGDKDLTLNRIHEKVNAVLRGEDSRVDQEKYRGAREALGRKIRKKMALQFGFRQKELLDFIEDKDDLADIVDSLMRDSVIEVIGRGRYKVKDDFRGFDRSRITAIGIERMLKPEGLDLLEKWLISRKLSFAVRSSNVDEDAADGTIQKDDFTGYNRRKVNRLLANLSSLHFIDNPRSRRVLAGFLKVKDRTEFEEFLDPEFKPDAEMIFGKIRGSLGSSFAGLGDTELYVPFDGLVDKVISNFASCCTERALHYRLSRDPGGSFKMGHAVVIQSMVNSEESAIAFSRNVNAEGEEVNNIEINISYGLGEGLVSGKVDSDIVIIDRWSNQELAYITGKKDKAVRRSAKGTGTHIVRVKDESNNGLKTESVRRSRAVSPDVTRRIADIVVKLEAHYKSPVDTEWGIENGELFLLQVRPITALEGYYEERKSYLESLIVNDSINFVPFVQNKRDSLRKLREMIEIRDVDKELLLISNRENIRDLVELVEIWFKKNQREGVLSKNFIIEDFILLLEDIFLREDRGYKEVITEYIRLSGQNILWDKDMDELIGIFIETGLLEKLALLKDMSLDDYLEIYSTFFNEKRGFVISKYRDRYRTNYKRLHQLGMGAIGNGTLYDDLEEALDLVQRTVHGNRTDREKAYIGALQNILPEKGRDPDGERTFAYNKNIRPKIVEAFNIILERIAGLDAEDRYSKGADMYEYVVKRLNAMLEGEDDLIYLFDARVEGSENYILGFNVIEADNLIKLGLARELIEILPVNILAEYIFHEVYGEITISHKELYGKRDGVRRVRDKFSPQGMLFGEQNPLENLLRQVIERKLIVQDFNEDMIMEPDDASVKDIAERKDALIGSGEAISGKESDIKVIAGYRSDIQGDARLTPVLREFNSRIKFKFGNNRDNQQVRMFVISEDDTETMMSFLEELIGSYDNYGKGHISRIVAYAPPLKWTEKNIDVKQAILDWVRANPEDVEGFAPDLIETVLKDEGVTIIKDSYSDCADEEGGIKFPDIALRFILARHIAGLFQAENPDAVNAIMDEIIGLLMIGDPSLEDEAGSLDRSDIDKFLNGIVVNITPIDYAEITQYREMMHAVAVSL